MMNMWAALAMDRNNLPCVGKPRVSFSDEETSDEPHPFNKHKVGDIIAEKWELIGFMKGQRTDAGRFNSSWICVCRCGCREERVISSSNVNKGRMPKCAAERQNAGRNQKTSV